MTETPTEPDCAQATAALSPEEAACWERARQPQPLPAVLRDYVRTDYPPVCDPRGKAASHSLLRYYLLREGLFDGLWPIVERFVELLGPGETVWGFKRLPRGGTGVELYVYDPRREASQQPKGRDNPRSVTQLVQGLSPILDVNSRLDDNHVAYHMCSLSLDARVAETGHSEGFRIYPTGDRRRHGYDGLSYHVDGDRLVRENSYLFFRAAEELDQVRALVDVSLRAGNAASRAALLDPDLCRCWTICFSNKAHGDALYFSRIDIDQLLGALPRFWPGYLERLLQARRHELDHLRWDLGIDFTTPGTELHDVCIDKVGLYGFI